MVRGRRVLSLSVATTDLPALERFQGELVTAGFEPTDASRRTWVGPIAAPLAAFTDAQTMALEFVDGWPFHQPRLLVEGIASEHVNALGEVCLWPPGDASRGWLTLAGLHARIVEWSEAAEQGFRDQDAVLDAHLYFGDHVYPGIATAYLDRLGVKGGHGESGRIYGRWQQAGLRLELNSRADGAAVEGRWYYADRVAVPPSVLAGVQALLTASQQRSLAAGVRAVRSGKGERVVVLLWDGPGGRNLLVLLLRLENGTFVARAIEAAPSDERFLALRAGPDVAALRENTVVVFGAGAVGSQLALRLAECGVGALVLCDSELLRPGNVIRHAAGRTAVGMRKVEAVAALIGERVPWTKVELAAKTWHPVELAAAATGADLVVDATGSAGFADLLSVVCAETATVLVSAALYRGGAIGRVRRQAVGRDAAICERATDERYPRIPPGDEPLELEPGCSAPVHNASPVAVAALAALAAAVVIDALRGRFAYEDETIEVFVPLEEAPFDLLGRIRR